MPLFAGRVVHPHLSAAQRCLLHKSEYKNCRGNHLLTLFVRCFTILFTAVEKNTVPLCHTTDYEVYFSLLKWRVKLITNIIFVLYFLGSQTCGTGSCTKVVVNFRY